MIFIEETRLSLVRVWKDREAKQDREVSFDLRPPLRAFSLLQENDDDDNW